MRPRNTLESAIRPPVLVSGITFGLLASHIRSPITKVDTEPGGFLARVRYPVHYKLRRHKCESGSIRLVVFLAIACVVLISSFSIARSDDDKKDFALQFNAASGSMATGAPVNRTDNLRMEALVRYDGPSANGGVLLYNGNGCCNGWGLLMYGNNSGSNAGRLAILAGGVTVQDSQQPLTLPVGVWQRVRVESRGQFVTLSFPGNDNPGPVFSFGIVPRNSLNFEAASSVIVGQGFNGLIRDVRFTSLDTPNALLEFWPFNEGAGSTATSIEGTVLNLTNTSWVRVSKDDNDNDNKNDN